jgi:hypothetical protein
MGTGDATDEQRRLIYECAMRIPATPKPDEPIYPGDGGRGIRVIDITLSTYRRRT